MQSEALNEVYIAATITAMQAMAAVSADTTRPIDERLKAAAAVSGMGDTIVKANVITDAMNKGDKTNRKMLSALDKLTDHDKDA